MKQRELFFALMIFITLEILTIECGKKYKFLALDACNTQSGIINITKCEVTDEYFTLKANVNNPLTQIFVGSLLILYN